jgi:hypothetical protein
MPLASTQETTNRLPESALNAPFTAADATGVDGALLWSILGSGTDTVTGVGVLGGSGAGARAGDGEGDATAAETGLDVGC